MNEMVFVVMRECEDTFYGYFATKLFAKAKDAYKYVVAEEMFEDDYFSDEYRIELWEIL